tara:strand:- start:297 stop:551 length:255 start_codon:yes stop_codon:yes gene_type:complete
VAHPAGLEPATRCLEGSRSIQLSYGCKGFDDKLFLDAFFDIVKEFSTKNRERAEALSPGQRVRGLMKESPLSVIEPFLLRLPSC